MQLVLFGTIGLVAGVLSGLFGIGGGVVIVPALIYLGRVPTATALGTSLGALLLPVGLLGALTYWKAGHMHVPAAALVAAGLFLGAFFGAKLALGMPPQMLTRLFAVFLVLIAIRMWVSA